MDVLGLVEVRFQVVVREGRLCGIQVLWLLSNFYGLRARVDRMCIFGGINGEYSPRVKLFIFTSLQGIWGNGECLGVQRHTGYVSAHVSVNSISFVHRRAYTPPIPQIPHMYM